MALSQGEVDEAVLYAKVMGNVYLSYFIAIIVFLVYWSGSLMTPMWP